MRITNALLLAGLTLLALAAVLAAGVLAAVALPTDVHGQSIGSFGIRPTRTTEDDPSGGAYFNYSLQAGAGISDEALVVNNSAGPVSLSLYAADGATAINGGTAFAGNEEDRNGVRSWLSIETSNVDVQAGESVPVPFSVQVPATATPGDHVAGIIVEAPPKAGPSGGLGAAVIERVGVAVVIHVPGPGNESLTLGGICLNQETGSNYFEVPVANDGNVLTRAEGTLRLEYEDGSEVFQRDVVLGTVLPGDSTELRMDAPFDPGSGAYVANLSLTRSDGADVETAAAINIVDVKTNGCASAVAGEGQQPGDPSRRSSSESGDGFGFPWLIALLGGLAITLAVLLAMRELVWRRRRSSGG
jgi:hypothetical protein